MTSSTDRPQAADPTRHLNYSPALRRRLHIDDYRVPRWRSLTRAAEVRRQRAYFPTNSAPFGHYTLRLQCEQLQMLRLRNTCRLVREEMQLLQALRQRQRAVGHHCG